MTQTSSRRERRASPRDPEGRMPLVEHLRELRRRVFRSVVAILIATVISFFFYGHLFDIVTQPFESIRERYAAEGATVTLNFGGVADPFSYALRICALTGILASSPVWLYQAWAFVTPGLHRNERRWGIAFIVISVPLFLIGAVIAYLFLPKGFDLLVGFNPRPQRVANIIGFDKYLAFVTRMILVFGLAFVLPVFLVALNLAHVVHGRQLFAIWRWVVVGGFVFAAVATPSGDPWTMLALGTPMLALYFASATVCLILDRRRRQAGVDGLDYDTLDDDTASPLHDPDGVSAASPLDAPDDIDDIT